MLVEQNKLIAVLEQKLLEFYIVFQILSIFASSVQLQPSDSKEAAFHSENWKMSSTKPVLGYWEIRGIAHHIRLMLTYLGVDFEDKLYGFGPSTNPSYDSWIHVKSKLGLDFANLPYWIDGDVKISENRAIVRYIADTRGPHLNPKTARDNAIVTMVEGVMTDLHRALINHSYTKAVPVSEEPIETSLAPKFKKLNAFLENKKYILGEQLSFVDFYVYEVLVQFQKFYPDFLKPYPALKSYEKRFGSIPELIEYIKATDYLTCYSPFCRICHALVLKSQPCNPCCPQTN